VQSDRNANVFNYAPAVAGSATTTVVPQVQSQQTTANLAAGAAITFDFVIDTNPIFDLFVFADQVLTINVYIRQSGSDTFRLLNNAQYAAGIANVLGDLIAGQRFPGSQVRIELKNNSGVGTTILSAQVHSRSL